MDHHNFKAGHSGMACVVMVELTDGTGDACGRPSDWPIHFCRNAFGGVEHLFCTHRGGVITPGTAELDGNGECVICAAGSAWNGIGEPPSYLDPEEA
jgi:hypothetical protein